MNREKLLTISVVLLLLLNLGTLGFLLLGPKPHPPQGPGPGREGRPGQALIEQLKLDETQQTAFEALKKAHHAKIEELNQQQESILQQYFGQLTAPNPQPTLRDSLEQKLGDIERSRAAVTYEHFSKVKALCKPEQLPAFNDFVPNHLIGIMLQPQGGRRGPRDGGR